jgi:hypothetical protein
MPTPVIEISLNNSDRDWTGADAGKNSNKQAKI